MTEEPRKRNIRYTFDVIEPTSEPAGSAPQEYREGMEAILRDLLASGWRDPRPFREQMNAAHRLLLDSGDITAMGVRVLNLILDQLDDPKEKN